MKNIALINNGCAKNLVDSELMLGLLADKGYNITLDETKADIVIVNTCSFIHDAEKESIQDILKMAMDGKKVIVTGCLPQKHKMELKKAIPEIIAMLGTSDLSKVIDVIEKIERNPDNFYYEVSEKPEYIYPEMVSRQQITVGASSYIKIADGCNFKCGYCIIPQLRGEYHSRKIEDIVEEAKKLGDKGVNEIILIAQDTTSYGQDLSGLKNQNLSELIKQLDKIDSFEWIRIMYTYPSFITDELLDIINDSKKVVNYIDMPIQHSHPEVLKSMRRPIIDYRSLISKIRNKVKNVALRTTFIVGYPGETEEQFNHLYNFVNDIKFDKLGVFKYSKEENTFAASLGNQISPYIKSKRKKALMELQQKISLEINKSLIGKKIPSIIETITQENQIIGRTYRDAPEIDGQIYINNTDKILVPGDIVNVEVKKADEYDLWGEII